MDPSNNQNSPSRQYSPPPQNYENQYSPRRQNFSLNFSDPPPYYPQNPKNPQIPPPNYSHQYSHHYSHHSPNHSLYPPSYGAPHGYHNYPPPPPHYYPPSHGNQNYGSPVERRHSQERHSSGRESRTEAGQDDFEVREEPQQVDEDPKNRRQWEKDEDEALISCFLKFSVDSIVGTNQKEPILWAKIHRAYQEIQHASQGSMPRRKQESLRGRWRRISSGISKWVGCYEQADRRRRSGMSEDDVIADALAIYSSDNNGSKFMYMRQWIMLKMQPRWETFLRQDSQQTITHEMGDSNSSGKRIRLSDDLENNFDNLCTGGQEEESVPETAPQGPPQPSHGTSRPLGRQAAKKSKGKKKVVDEDVQVVDEATRSREREHMTQVLNTKKELAYLETFNNLINKGKVSELSELEKISLRVVCKKLGFDASCLDD